ncbi:hypothetical protein IDH44_03215 [Paenibacillus sp. IB182496]|uniref:Uncharacterized protein n=1 Tax=Paenibacillus sabuli TaxID=2772509 RepID=A0A927GQE3_9BACL|nr:hypothetical protein [Paenibacillus sabuli]MBD2844186.1 hypothetical protein [Paenibacillus sabuli]
MFEKAFAVFMDDQQKLAHGARLERLQKNKTGEIKMLESVLWPVFQTFDGFELEYPMTSLTGVTIFVDVFYAPLGLAFESEGYVPHAGAITRERFSFERMRIRTIAMYGYKYIPFAWDEMEQRPEACRRSVYELLGRFSGSSSSSFNDLSVYERELVRCAVQLKRPFRMQDAMMALQLQGTTTRKVIKSLIAKRIIVGTGKQRNHKYELLPQALEQLWRG